MWWDAARVTLFAFIASWALASLGVDVVGAGYAANVNSVRSKDCKFELSGEIVPGDTGKVKILAEKLGVLEKNSSEGDHTFRICLNSTGGSWDEGIKLAKYFMGAGVGTVVPAGAVCESACAIAFMGGRNLAGEADSFNRILHVDGQLGFHSPFLTVEEGRYDKVTVETAYQTAVNSIGLFMEMAGSVGGYSGTPRVQPQLVAEMLKTPQRQIYRIDTVDKAGRFDIDLAGVAQGNVGNAALLVACSNVREWKFRRKSAIWESSSYFQSWLADRINVFQKSSITTATGERFETVQFDITDNDGSSSCRAAWQSRKPEYVWLDISDNKNEKCPENEVCGPVYNLAWVGQSPRTEIVKLKSSSIATRPAALRLLKEVGNSHIGGSDLRVIRQTTFDGCFAECSSNESCKALSFDRWNRMCFLKSEIGVLNSDAKYQAAYDAQLGSPPTSKATVKMVPYKGKAFIGIPTEGISWPTGTSYEACSRVCLEMSCAAFSYFRSKRDCRLFPVVDDYKADPDADSGARRQD